MTPEQLRASILQYAMEGKLVKQDPNDEPASVLLEKIKAEKEQLIKEKKIKRTKALPEITDDEKSFDIPDNWEWVRLGDAFTILRGGSPRPIKNYLTDDKDGINWIKIGDTDPNNKYINHAQEKIISEGLKKTRIVHKGDFILSNSMSFGRPYILKIDGAVHDGWLIISNYKKLFNKDFLYYLLISPFINNQFTSLATGSTVKNLNRERVAKTIGVIPPLEEQKRIVVKIKKMLPLVDQYAKAYNRLKEIDDNFNDKLKQSILQYAMEGKLVKQDSNDEPASVLLEKIKAEKAELVKEKKIKKSRPLPPITDDEKPFDIPDSWEWARLGDIFYLKAGKNKKSSEIKSVQDAIYKYPCFGGNGIRGYVKDFNKTGDFALIGRQGALCGNINWAQGDFYATEHAVIVNTFAEVSSKWSGYFLRALNLNQYSTSTAQPGLSVSKINYVLIPVPPLSEQNRIVNKIEQLYGLI